MTDHTREALIEAIRTVTDTWDEPLDEVHDIPPLANALAIHVAAVVAEKDAEIERLTGIVDGLCALCGGTRESSSHLVGCPDLESALRDLDAALAQLGAIAALADEWDAHSRLFVAPVDLPVRQDWELIVRKLRAILADPAGAIAKREQQVRAAWAAEVGSAMERLIDLRSDYLPGLTGAQMPHLDLIQQEIATVQLVLRILRTGDARGWAHSSRWNELDGLDVLARAEALTEGQS